MQPTAVDAILLAIDDPLTTAVDKLEALVDRQIASFESSDKPTKDQFAPSAVAETCEIEPAVNEPDSAQPVPSLVSGQPRGRAPAPSAALPLPEQPSLF